MNRVHSSWPSQTLFDPDRRACPLPPTTGQRLASPPQDTAGRLTPNLISLSIMRGGALPTFHATTTIRPYTEFDQYLRYYGSDYYPGVVEIVVCIEIGLLGWPCPPNSNPSLRRITGVTGAARTSHRYSIIRALRRVSSRCGGARTAHITMAPR